MNTPGVPGVVAMVSLMTGMVAGSYYATQNTAYSTRRTARTRVPQQPSSVPLDAEITERDVRDRAIEESKDLQEKRDDDKDLRTKDATKEREAEELNMLLPVFSELRKMWYTDRKEMRLRPGPVISIPSPVITMEYENSKFAYEHAVHHHFSKLHSMSKSRFVEKLQVHQQKAVMPGGDRDTPYEIYVLTLPPLDPVNSYPDPATLVLCWFLHQGLVSKNLEWIAGDDVVVLFCGKQILTEATTTEIEQSSKGRFALFLLLEALAHVSKGRVVGLLNESDVSTVSQSSVGWNSILGRILRRRFPLVRVDGSRSASLLAGQHLLHPLSPSTGGSAAHVMDDKYVKDKALSAAAAKTLDQLRNTVSQQQRAKDEQVEKEARTRFYITDDKRDKQLPLITASKAPEKQEWVAVPDRDEEIEVGPTEGHAAAIVEASSVNSEIPAGQYRVCKVFGNSIKMLPPFSPSQQHVDVASPWVENLVSFVSMLLLTKTMSTLA